MKITTTLLVWMLAVLSVGAQTAPVSNAEQMEALLGKINNAYNFYYSTNDESGKLYDALAQMEKTIPPKMFLLAQKEPDSQAACDVFLWIAMKVWANRGPLLTNRLRSLDYLTKYHSTSSKFGSLCSYLGRSWSWRWSDKPVMGFLESVAKSNPDRAIRGQAIYGLGQMYAAKSQGLAEYENWGNAPFFRNTWITNELVSLTQSGSSQAAADEAEKQFKEVIANYADCTDLRELHNPKDEAPKLKKLVEENLFDLLHLSLGKTAPQIEAEDLDGKKFKLSDARGKICVLSFWASWCGPCMQLVPVERALFDRLHGESFTMIGVNGDAILADAKRATTREQMGWPSFWNGKNGPKGPISEAWNVHGWPTVFVLDAKGVIRFKTEGYGPQSSNVLNGCVDELMKQLTAKN